MPASCAAATLTARSPSPRGDRGRGSSPPGRPCVSARRLRGACVATWPVTYVSWWERSGGSPPCIRLTAPAGRPLSSLVLAPLALPDGALAEPLTLLEIIGTTTDPGERARL